MLSVIAQSADVLNQRRGKRARELLGQAREFHKSRDYVCCLDRCELLVGQYGDMIEGQEAAILLSEIKNNPEWMQGAVNAMNDRLGAMYLDMADAARKKNQPQEAEVILQRVIRTYPGLHQAESAQIRLSQLQGTPLRGGVLSAGPP